VNQALDAGSFFLFGIILRWLLFHKLSPCQAFLHEPTSSPSLCYDLMEPYRYLKEDSVACAYIDVGIDQESPLTAVSIEKLNRDLEVFSYVPATRQTAANENLLHGIILALRSYLIGDDKRFLVPVTGDKIGWRLN